jgi:hypothetical protein
MKPLLPTPIIITGKISETEKINDAASKKNLLKLFFIEKIFDYLSEKELQLFFL